MIKKPLEGRTPTGVNAIKAMETLERVTKVSHLRLNEFRVEGDLFIPRPWRMRGYVLCPNITNQGLLYRGDAINLDEHGNISPKYSMASLRNGGTGTVPVVLESNPWIVLLDFFILVSSGAMCFVDVDS